MAKEKETKEEKPEKKSERYELSDKVLNEGYTAQIPNKTGRLFKIGFNTDLKGDRLDQYASVMEETKNPARGGGVLWKATGIYYLEDLTDQQLWILAHAGVIRMTEQQQEAFKGKFYN